MSHLQSGDGGIVLSGSVALLADAVHNVGDALTAVPLWVAFSLARRPPTRRCTYGLGRVEDLAGIAVVLTILFSALCAAYESVEQGHAVAVEVRHQLPHHLEYLSDATVRVDPASASGEEQPHIENHRHDRLPPHSH
jgi:divalent metal cation (Fe/Co/Zn/Cd) transporter